MVSLITKLYFITLFSIALNGFIIVFDSIKSVIPKYVALQH